MWGWPGMMGFGGFGMIFGFFWFIAIIIGIVFLIVWLVRRFGNTTTSKTGTNSLEILKERYAKGDLSKDQYETMKKDIS